MEWLERWFELVDWPGLGGQLVLGALALAAWWATEDWRRRRLAGLIRLARKTRWPETPAGWAVIRVYQVRGHREEIPILYCDTREEALVDSQRLHTCRPENTTYEVQRRDYK